MHFFQAITELIISFFFTKGTALLGTVSVRNKTHVWLFLILENLRFFFLLSKMINWMSKKRVLQLGWSTCHDTVWKLTGWVAALLEKDLTSCWTTLQNACQQHAPATRKTNSIVVWKGRSIASRMRMVTLTRSHIENCVQVSGFGPSDRRRTSIKKSKVSRRPPRWLGARALTLQGGRENWACSAWEKGSFRGT